MTDSFAAEWASRIAGTSYVTMTPTQVEQFLAGLAERLVAALDAGDPTSGYAVGRALVEANFTDVETAAQTVALIGEKMGNTDNVYVLQGALAAGHSKALRDRVLTEQQEIVQATLLARAQAERLLRTSEIRFRTLFAEAALGILIADLSGQILDANQALLDMLGHPLDDLCRYDITDLAHPDDPPAVWSGYAELLHGDREDLRVDKPLVGRDGSELWTQLTLSLVRDDDGRPHRVVALFADVTDRHLLETRLRHLASHDPLTQLPNRAMFTERLEQLFKDGTVRVGLCFVDLDGFKVVNDSFGHATGDRLLVEIAGRLDKCVAGDGMVARIGGDEFIVLVTDTAGAGQVIVLAERLQAALRAPMWIDGHELSMSASIGIVERPVAGTDPADLLRAADITLYWAKAEGKARWALFDPVRNAREVARYSLSAAMPAALARGDFFLEYQPVMRLADGVVVGVEALVRWRHPGAGVLGPAQFLGLAEETGLILPLGRWVLDTACRQLASWRRRLPNADIFVNVHIGARQSRDPRLVDDVLRALDAAGLRPSALQLELTRVGCDETLPTLAVLSRKGIRIALGDFGPGHASLACLRGLPAHTLKIDRGFVQTLDPVDEQVVRALAGLAHELGLTVTADGIEGPDQVARLRSLGCDNGQGPFLAKAGPPEQVARLLTAIE